MSEFNLNKYLTNVLAKNTKNVSDQIEMKLVDKNKKDDTEEQNILTERQIDKHREDTKNSLIENTLEKVREGSSESLVEKRLDDNKSKIVKHRNPDAAKGDINKLEEKRVSSKNINEFAKYKPASEVEEPKRFWKVKSPDGLKIASVKKSADDDFDIDLPDYEPEDPLEKAERQYSENPREVVEKTLEDPSESGLGGEGFTEELPPDIMKELEKFEEPKEDLENDPDFLNSVFQWDEPISKDAGGTEIQQKSISFDLKDDDGELMEMFKSGESLDKDKLAEVVLNFILLEHPKEKVNKDSITLDINADFTGGATYIVPTF